MKYNFSIITGLLVAANLLQAQEPKLVNETFLAVLRSEAARNHPSSIAGKYKAVAAAHDVRAVRLWNDPMVGLALMGADKTMRADDGDITVAMEQALPKPGMFDAQRRKAEAMHRAELQNSLSSSIAAGAEASRSAIEVALADESIRLQESQITWLTAMTENAKQMAADPMGSSTDALRMETELAKEKQMLDAARRSREGYAQKLNLTLGRLLDSPWSAMKLPEYPPPTPIAQSEIARIPHANPKV
ncbi:MAG: TolC family protein, partial [Gloeobacteraceae cyanobacterium ES-bin-144]|nr:TolC family protein [Verrucomicrobiales bacterium]